MHKYTKYDTLSNTGLWKSLAFELVIILVAPLPFFDGLKYRETINAFEVSIEYEVNDILLYFSFNRLYLGIRFMLY